MDGHAFDPVTPSVRSSELLGFPPGARVLIVNCDDFGMHDAINAAVIDSIEQGIAGSCSLMVPCPSAPQAMRLLRRRPEMPFGIHLTLVCDLPGYRWGPLAAEDNVPSLLDDAGELFMATPAGRSEFLAQARLDEIELEFRAQINAVADAGLTPTHLDFHCLADGGRDDILDLTVALAAEYGLAVRVWLGPGRQRMRRQGLPVVDNGFLDSFSLSVEGKPARYAQLLRDLPAGLSEWAVHPSTGGEESRAIDSGRRVRRTDYEFLTSPEARELLQQEGIVVIDYRTVQQAWSSALR
ncbi:polysaccharide deacetylase family protein [Streptosporangium sp. NPDC003464]